MKINEFASITGIKYVVGDYCADEILLTTDSRKKENINTFLALKGENFDGYDYVKSVLSSNIKCVIFENFEGRKKEIETHALKFPHIVFICVENSLKYLQASSSYWIRKWQRDLGGKVLALTGSNGKTTTKEILYSFGRTIFGDDIICTKGNLNNHIGVPLTIFTIRPSHKFAIIEMGTNHPGEIEVLCNIANPNFGMITNVGAAHLEFLGSEEGVLEEKGALYRYINKHGEKFFLNCDDKYLNNLEITNKVICYSCEEKTHSLNNSYIKESFNRINLFFSYYVMSEIFPNQLENLKNTFSAIKLPDNKRSQWIKTETTKIYLDAYNANPSSMKASLESFISNEEIDLEKTLIICGDMNELGGNTKEYHREIGLFLKESKVRNAVFVGKYGEFYEAGYGDNCELYKNTAELSQNWSSYKKRFEFIFLKASRSLQLESLLDITD